MSADLLVVTWNGSRVELVDITQARQEHLDKVLAHANELELAIYNAAVSYGLDVPQQLAQILQSSTTYRAWELVRYME